MYINLDVFCPYAKILGLFSGHPDFSFHISSYLARGKYVPANFVEIFQYQY